LLACREGVLGRGAEGQQQEEEHPKGSSFDHISHSFLFWRYTLLHIFSF
jgi:hypothetical protein